MDDPPKVLIDIIYGGPFPLSILLFPFACLANVVCALLLLGVRIIYISCALPREGGHPHIYIPYVVHVWYVYV